LSTHNIANIFLVTTDQKRLNAFTEQMEKANYNILSGDPADLETQVKDSHPDLVIVDVSSQNTNGFDQVKTLKSNPTLKNIPVVVMAAEKSEDLFKNALDVDADDIIFEDNDVAEIITHTKPLLRLSTMFTELENRADLAGEMGISTKTEIKPDHSSPYKILLIAPQDGDRATLEAVLDGHCDIETCEDFFAAEDKLTHGIFDAAICSLTDENQETVLGLSARIRNNPRLFNLPMILLCEKQLDNPIEAYRRGVTRLVQRPINQSSLKAKIVMLVRRQRLRWNIRQAIDTTKQENNTDVVTRAYSREFFDKHLLEQLNNAKKYKKHMAVIFFSIPNISEIEKKFGEKSAEHLLQQTYQWIAGLTRVEDLVARAGEHEFAIALPDTPIEEAQIVMHRIAGILSYTDFAVVDVFQPISVWVESGLAALQSDDTTTTLIERARHNID
jgi:two-component system cell cycle response regulator